MDLKRSLFFFFVLSFAFFLSGCEQLAKVADFLEKLGKTAQGLSAILKSIYSLTGSAANEAKKVQDETTGSKTDEKPPGDESAGGIANPALTVLCSLSPEHREIGVLTALIRKKTSSADPITLESAFPDHVPKVYPVLMCL